MPSHSLDESRSLYDRIDDYFLKKRSPNDPPSRRQDDRALVREPAKLAFALGKNSWLLTTCSWTNILFPFVPIALATGGGTVDEGGRFWLSYAALIWAFGLFRYGSEELSIPGLRAIGKVWNITLGVFSLDLEIAVIAVCRGHLELVKAYIVGKIVSTSLLTLGICFSVAGVRRAESQFDITNASRLTSLLATAIVPFGILALFPSGFGGNLTSPPVLAFSRAASFVLLGLFLLHKLLPMIPPSEWVQSLDHRDDPDFPGRFVPTLNAWRRPPRRNQRSGQLGSFLGLLVVLGTAVIAYFCVSPILAAAEGTGVPPKIFTGFCLLPLLAEVAEISRICRLAWVDRMEDVLEAAAGASIDIALFGAPILCLLGWCLKQPMSLSLTLLEVVSFGVSVWIFGYLIQDGKSNYMEGVMSIGLYLIQVPAFYLNGRH